MARVVDVPLNTAIADLDEALRTLVKRELDKHGFEGVEIAFDAPAKEWSGKLTGPTVNLFLYDMRESLDRASASPSERRSNGNAVISDPPLQLELTYAVTAWTKAVQDEHRLLSQVLAILYSYSSVPSDVIAENATATLARAQTSVGRPREEKADFWTSVGGQYKASIDYVVQIVIESGATFVRGPHHDDPHASDRQPALDARGAAPRCRDRHRHGGRDVVRRVGRAARLGSLGRHGPRGSFHLRSGGARDPSGRGANRRRPRGHRDHRGPGWALRPRRRIPAHAVRPDVT
jgi:hypothetical protein